MVLARSVLFAHIALVLSHVSWEHCGTPSDDVRLCNLTVTPDPIVAPGPLSIGITIQTTQNLTGPLQTTIALRKKILVGYFAVPCSAIGSCMYDDLCAVCTQCNCSMQVGEHTFTLPISIQSGSWMLAGTYQAQVDLRTGTGQSACVRVSDIVISTRK